MSKCKFDLTSVARVDSVREFDRTSGQSFWGRDTVPAEGLGASVIDLLANPKMRLDSVKRMTQIQNTSWSFAEAN